MTNKKNISSVLSINNPPHKRHYVHWTRNTCYEEAKKYKSRNEFQKNNESAYTVARKNKWLDDYTWFIPSQSALKWTKDTCYDEAKKYKSVHDFRKESPNAYNVAAKNGWLDDYTWLERRKKQNGYWTRERCYQEAKKYKSKRSFELESHSAYHIARRNGWFNDYIWLESSFKPTGFWNQENCYNEAKKYKSRGSFQHGNGSAYAAARINGWLDDYTWFEEIKKPNAYWTKERCYDEAKKYKSKTEFQRACVRGYKLSLINAWLNDYTWFEEHKKPNGYWSRERCYEEAKKCMSAAEFRRMNSSAHSASQSNGWLSDYTWFKKRAVSDKPIYVVYCYRDEETNSIYIGLANNMKRRHREHCRGFVKRGERRYDTVYKFFHSLGKDVPNPIILKQDLWVDDARAYEALFVDKYKNESLNVINLMKAGSIGGVGGTWTKEKCSDESKRYKTRSEFKLGNPSAYQSALRNKWLDDYIWLSAPKTIKGATKYTKEFCRQEALKYTSKSGFKNGNNRAYIIAKRNGWLEEYTWFNSSQKE